VIADLKVSLGIEGLSGRTR